MRNLLRRIGRWWRRLWAPPPFVRTDDGYYVSPEGVPYSVGADPVGGQQNAVRVVLYHAWEPVIPHTRVPGLEDIVDANAGAIRDCVRRLLREADAISARYRDALDEFEPAPEATERIDLTDEAMLKVADAVVDRIAEAATPAEG